MRIADLSMLDYLHDARVFHITYDLEREDDRSLILSVVCHPDSGYDAWNGKHLTVRLQGMVLLSLLAFGAVTGKERINLWSWGVSDSMESELNRLQEFGIDCTGTRFTLAFQSGSVLEGLCRSIIVETCSKPCDK